MQAGFSAQVGGAVLIDSVRALPDDAKLRTPTHDAIRAIEVKAFCQSHAKRGEGELRTRSTSGSYALGANVIEEFYEEPRVPLWRRKEFQEYAPRSTRTSAFALSALVGTSPIGTLISARGDTLDCATPPLMSS